MPDWRATLPPAPGPVLITRTFACGGNASGPAVSATTMISPTGSDCARTEATAASNDGRPTVGITTDTDPDVHGLVDIGANPPVPLVAPVAPVPPVPLDSGIALVTWPPPCVRVVRRVVGDPG